MVAFSRITFAIALAGLSSAQSFSGPAPTGLPSDFPSGVARPTGGFGGHGGHHGEHHDGLHGGFPHPTGGFHFGGPRPFGTGVVAAERVQQTGVAPYPSGAARPSGHHGHHDGHHGGFPHPTGGAQRVQERGAAPYPSGAAQPSGHYGHHDGHHDGHHGGFPHPTGGFPHPTGGFHFSGPRPFGTGVVAAERVQETGVPYPSGAAQPSGHQGHHGKGGKEHHSGRPNGVAPPHGARPTGARPFGVRPSGARPTGFVTSTVRGA